MCGIWAFFSKRLNVSYETTKIKSANPINKTSKSLEEIMTYDFNTLKQRGPDATNIIYNLRSQTLQYKLGFHRLAIMDQSMKGMQPFSYNLNDKQRIVFSLCNGEIYNYKQLCKSYNLNPKSGSDCEIIPLLYNKCGIDVLANNLIGEFAYIIVDVNMATETQAEGSDMKVYISRDPFGVRPLFYSDDPNHVAFASVAKGLVHFNSNIKPFPPATIMRLNFKIDSSQQVLYQFRTKQYYHYNYPLNLTHSLTTIKLGIRLHLTEAVKCRLISDRPVGCLLSGGLDSSLVAAIASNELKKDGRQLKTFCIGMEGSPDIHYANIVAKHIDSDHTVISFTPKEALEIIPLVIKTIESYDITTVRASVVQFLLAKYISENTDIKVILNGDFSDELAGSYLYFHNAPSEEEYHDECVRLLKEIHLYDALRVDRTIAHHGLEARVPFSDYRLIDFFLKLDPKLRMPRTSIDLDIFDKKIEKPLIREAFANTDLLPRSILTRVKEAFSDGCSKQEKSWYNIIQEHVSTLITDEEFESEQIKYTLNRPPNKEAYYYRQIFQKYYGELNAKLIPHFWLPQWSGSVTEPSARILKVYKDTIEK